MTTAGVARIPFILYRKSAVAFITFAHLYAVEGFQHERLYPVKSEIVLSVAAFDGKFVLKFRIEYMNNFCPGEADGFLLIYDPCLSGQGGGNRNFNVAVYLYISSFPSIEFSWFQN